MAVSGTTVALLLVCLAIALPHQTSGITCGQVVSSLGSCIPYVRSRGAGAVPPACCGGVRSLYSSVPSTPDRQVVCNCLKRTAAGLSGVNYGLIAGIPSKCGVNIPYKISPTTDCSRVR